MRLQRQTRASARTVSIPVPCLPCCELRRSRGRPALTGPSPRRGKLQGVRDCRERLREHNLTRGWCSGNSGYALAVRQSCGEARARPVCQQQRSLPFPRLRPAPCSVRTHSYAPFPGRGGESRREGEMRVVGGGDLC